MSRTPAQVREGLDALRDAVAQALSTGSAGTPRLALGGVPASGLRAGVTRGPAPTRTARSGAERWLWSEADVGSGPAPRPTDDPAGMPGGAVADQATGLPDTEPSARRTGGRTTEPSGDDTTGLESPSGRPDDHAHVDRSASSEQSQADRDRLIGLVDLARGGDSEAFGLLFDHYHPLVYRFLYHRTRSAPLAEDLTSETFVRALRNMSGFRWQGRDFAAWLMTIARNLANDHFKASRTRLEMSTEDMGVHDAPTDGPESAVLTQMTHEILLRALTELPSEQRDCLVMRFLQGLSIAETAQVLDRSVGAVKQLQLRGVRNLAKLVPEGVR